MCGIFGKLYFKSRREERQNLLACLNTLSHRGPDDTGYYEDEMIFLGSKRLSIIDLSRDGHMPMANEDGTLIIIFNGEVYNYLELKRSLLKKHVFKSNTDTEVVLHLFEQFGPSCLGKLRGMFAFAIWDTKKKELFLARDQLGKKPLKYFCGSDFLIFGSELKALLKDPHVPKEIDPAAIDDFLTYQYVPSPRTGFKNILKLEPAHYLIVNHDGTIMKHKYWKPEFQPKMDISLERLEDMLLNQLKESVRLRLRSDVPLGAHLSGGVDSSLIVALAALELNKPLKTFSVGFSEPNFNELPYARLVADKYGTDHHEIMVEPEIINELSSMVYYYEEPYADPSMLPTWRLCRETKKDVTVVLNGDGGDENFAGYLRYGVFMIYRFLHHLPFPQQIEAACLILHRLVPVQSLRHAAKLFGYMHRLKDDTSMYAKLVGCMDDREKHSLYSDEFGALVGDNRSLGYLRPRIENTALTPLDRLLAADIETYLSEDLLTKVDIAGMANSLEIRSPMLDQRFIDFAAKIPDSFKLRGMDGKFILKDIARRFIPRQCINREKKGFGIPLKIWMEQKWGSQTDSLLEEKFYSYGIFDKEQIQVLMEDKPSNYNHLWTLLVLKEWLNVWF